MRRYIPFLALVSGSILLPACSKKNTPAATPTPAAAANPAPAPAENNDGISFSLSGNKPGGAGTSATDTFSPNKPAGAADTESPRLLARVIPFYPLSMRMQGIEGRVDIRILINTEGRVERAEVISSTEPKFVDFALAAVRLFRFTPARENGKAIPIATAFSVPFLSEFGTGSMPPDSPLARLAYLSGEFYSVNETGKLSRAEIKKPLALLQMEPAIPETGKPGETLTAKVKFTLTEEGQVVNPTISDSTNAEFTRAIQEVMPFWQFIPRIKNGKPVAMTVELPFTLKVPEKAAR